MKSKEAYRSLYFDVDKYHESTASKEGWDKQELASAIETLEMLPKRSLIELVQAFEISFETPETMGLADEEQLISILLSDVPKEKLLRELGKYREQ